MKTLFSWLGWSDLKAFYNAVGISNWQGLEQNQLIHTLIPESDLPPLNSLLDQAVFKEIYLFYHFHFESEEKFKKWLRPDVKLVFIDSSSKRVTMPQALLIKLASLTHEFKIDFGILPRGTPETKNLLEMVCQEKHCCCYDIKDDRLVECFY